MCMVNRKTSRTDSENPAGLKSVAGESSELRKSREKQVLALLAEQKSIIDRDHALQAEFDEPDRTSADDLDRTYYDTMCIVRSQVGSSPAALQARIDELRSGTRQRLCVICDKVISQERLDAIPTATRCVRCEENIEKKRSSAAIPAAPAYNPPRRHPKQ